MVAAREFPKKIPHSHANLSVSKGLFFNFLFPQNTKGGAYMSMFLNPKQYSLCLPPSNHVLVDFNVHSIVENQIPASFLADPPFPFSNFLSPSDALLQWSCNPQDLQPSNPNLYLPDISQLPAPNSLNAFTLPNLYDDELNSLPHLSKLP